MNEENEIIDRVAVAQWARTNQRIIVEHADAQGRPLLSSGYVAQLSTTLLTLESGSRRSTVVLARVTRIEPVQRKNHQRPAGAQKTGAP
jgi:hypothetical protein